MNDIEVIRKFISVDPTYNAFKYSSLEKIVLNAFRKPVKQNKYVEIEEISDHIIEGSIRSMNRVFKMTSNKEIRNLKGWLTKRIKEESEFRTNQFKIDIESYI